MIQIINTGVANIRSLQATFDRLSLRWSLTVDPTQIVEADKVVLPGVGAFAAAVEAIDRAGLRQPILDRIAADRSLLCICLGLQLLAECSDEAPGVAGLAVIPSHIKKFSEQVQVPQLGWNEVLPVREDPTVHPSTTHSAGVPPKFPFVRGEAYFANSFRLGTAPDGWGFAETEYDGPFVSSLWRGRLLACQFHPELSGTWGETLIREWADA